MISIFHLMEEGLILQFARCSTVSLIFRKFDEVSNLAIVGAGTPVMD